MGDIRNSKDPVSRTVWQTDYETPMAGIDFAHTEG